MSGVFAKLADDEDDDDDDLAASLHQRPAQNQSITGERLSHSTCSRLGLGYAHRQPIAESRCGRLVSDPTAGQHMLELSRRAPRTARVELICGPDNGKI